MTQRKRKRKNGPTGADCCCWTQEVPVRWHPAVETSLQKEKERRSDDLRKRLFSPGPRRRRPERRHGRAEAGELQWREPVLAQEKEELERRNTLVSVANADCPAIPFCFANNLIVLHTMSSRKIKKGKQEKLACKSSCWMTARVPVSGSSSALRDFMASKCCRRSSFLLAISCSSGSSMALRPKMEVSPLPETCWAAMPMLNVLTIRSSAVVRQEEKKCLKKFRAEEKKNVCDGDGREQQSACGPTKRWPSGVCPAHPFLSVEMFFPWTDGCTAHSVRRRQRRLLCITVHQ